MKYINATIFFQIFRNPELLKRIYLILHEMYKISLCKVYFPLICLFHFHKYLKMKKKILRNSETPSV